VFDTTGRTEPRQCTDASRASLGVAASSAHVASSSTVLPSGTVPVAGSPRRPRPGLCVARAAEQGEDQRAVRDHRRRVSSGDRLPSRSIQRSPCRCPRADGCIALSTSRPKRCVAGQVGGRSLLPDAVRSEPLSGAGASRTRSGSPCALTCSIGRSGGSDHWLDVEAHQEAPPGLPSNRVATSPATALPRPVHLFQERRTTRNLASWGMRSSIGLEVVADQSVVACDPRIRRRRRGSPRRPGRACGNPRRSTSVRRRVREPDAFGGRDGGFVPALRSSCRSRADGADPHPRRGEGHLVS
jgi:hypothetical protein